MRPTRLLCGPYIEHVHYRFLVRLDATVVVVVEIDSVGEANGVALLQRLDAAEHDLSFVALVVVSRRHRALR